MCGWFFLRSVYTYAYTQLCPLGNCTLSVRVACVTGVKPAVAKQVFLATFNEGSFSQFLVALLGRRTGFLAPSSKLLQNWLRHWKGTLYLHAAVRQCCQHLPKGLLLIRLWKQHDIEAHEACVPWIEEKGEFSLISEDLGVICEGVSNVDSYKRKAWYAWVVCLLSFSSPQKFVFVYL